jgi:hypothetical protein
MGVPGVHHGLRDGLKAFPECDGTRVHEMVDEPREVFETLPQNGPFVADNGKTMRKNDAGGCPYAPI